MLIDFPLGVLELIDPAVKGTTGILESATKFGCVCLILYALVTPSLFISTNF